MKLQRPTGTAAAAALGAALAAGFGLFLWSRERELAAEESTEEEVEAHPS